MQRKWFGLGACLSIFGLVGCATISPGAASSGAIGCAEKDIRISNDDLGLSTRTWQAECSGKRYFCSGTAGTPNHVSCTLANDTPAVATSTEAAARVDALAATQPVAAAQPCPPVESGCAYDTQCKGERICRDHQCVDP
jgi:hypothetical protein